MLFGASMPASVGAPSFFLPIGLLQTLLTSNQCNDLWEGFFYPYNTYFHSFYYKS